MGRPGPSYVADRSRSMTRRVLESAARPPSMGGGGSRPPSRAGSWAAGVLAANPPAGESTSIALSPAVTEAVKGSGGSAEGSRGGLPRRLTGEVTRGGAGDTPRGRTGDMPRGGCGNTPRGGAGDTPRGGAGDIPRRPTGDSTRSGAGDIPRCLPTGDSTRGSGGRLAAGPSLSRLAGDTRGGSKISERRPSATSPPTWSPAGKEAGSDSGRGSPRVVRTGGDAASEL